MTPTGQKAYDVVQRVFDKELDPASAWQQLDEIGQGATGRAALEVGDAATYLQRLAGPPQVSARSIADQVMR